MTSVNKNLTQGSHTFVLEFYEHTGSARVSLDATLPANGVSAAPSSCGDKKYFGQNQLTVINAENITAMTLTIKVAQTTGVAYSNQYTTFNAGLVTSTHTASGGVRDLHVQTRRRRHHHQRYLDGGGAMVG